MEKIIKSDIDAVSLVIDPSGKLSTLLSNLGDTRRNILNKSTEEMEAIHKRRIEIRIKIENLLSDKIKNI
jgi:hypothetical protein